MGVAGGTIGYVVSVSITTKVNLQRRFYCLTCLSGSAAVVSLHGYLPWEKTTFCNIVHVTYHPRVVDRHILLCRVTRHRSIRTHYMLGGIQCIRHFKVTLGKIQSTWSFQPRWSQISHSSSIQGRRGIFMNYLSYFTFFNKKYF